MITYYVVYILFGFVGFITQPLLALPDATLPASITTALSTIGGWFGIVWNAVPNTFAALFGAMVVIVGVETKIFSYKTLRWIYSKIPGVN